MTARAGIRWGILGCARIARRGLIPGIARSRQGVQHAIASRDLAVARSWALEFGISRAHGSYESLVSDPEIDAVYIPLPNELHRPWMMAAADAGKHVLCEKPLALDAREALAMVEYARNRGVILMEAFMWRHQERTLRIRQMVRDGAIGELRLIRSSFSFPIAPDDWRLDRSRGGGALWDVGCYGVNTARFFAGEEPSRFKSFARFGPTGVDLTLTATLEFPGGVLAIVDCSFEQPFRCHYELSGTRGLIDVPLAYLPGAGENPGADLIKIDSDKNADSQPQRSTPLEFEPTDQYAAMVDHFAECVLARKLVDPAEDGLAQMVALESVHSAAF
jgi:D-xylose 1-dehydrogenase (NADP+, D-xylono-1,5-lactone-forming)